MPFDNSSAKRKPYADARILLTVQPLENVEYPVPVFLGYAYSVVPHGKDPFGPFPDRRNIVFGWIFRLNFMAFAIRFWNT